jgi:tyrosyl-tRNA synthetase
MQRNKEADMDISEQMRILAQGATEIVNPDELRDKLQCAAQEGRPLTVKFGMDPSAPDIHLGHTVPLRKIRQFQDMGHRAVIIIGDFTARIGDPTGRSRTRPALTAEQVAQNAQTYQQQVFRVLDPEKTELQFNSTWLGQLNFTDVVALAAQSTVARMLERDDFHNRFAAQQSIGVHELLYPLMQAYDSVHMHADVELGGTDQRFNILCGRDLQRGYGQDAQCAIFMPLLEGLDGKEKMSKSLANYVGIDERADDIVGKLMSIPDGLITRYFVLVTDIHPDELAALETGLADGTTHPRDAKMRLATEVAALYHGQQAAAQARAHFESRFSRRELPQDAPDFTVPKEFESAEGCDAARLLFAAELAPSLSEARRLVAQGALRLNGNKLDGATLCWRNGDILQVGKLRAVRLREECSHG